MARKASVLLLISTGTNHTMDSNPADDTDQQKWAKQVKPGKEVVTNLQFYFHDTLNSLGHPSIPGTQTTIFRTFFRALMMADDMLSVGPELTSKIVGHAHGLYGAAGQMELGLLCLACNSCKQ
ncbi:hypothetical protein LguiA_009094 [Lonicera macranthoides]